MPRRLGDDPLARARDERAKAVQVTAAVQPAGDQQRVRALAHSSYNDVFFQRRVEAQAQSATPNLRDAPEISEISEIPEIRDAAAATLVAAPTAPVAEALLLTSVSTVPVAVVDARSQTPAPATFSDALPEISDVSPEHPAATVPEADEQKSGGFFKRLFGKFK